MFGVGITSYDLFLHFAYKDGEYDASRVLSRECYEMWLNTRRNLPTTPEDAFRRHITAHITGTRKRSPFPPNMEKDLLVFVRSSTVWPCFRNQCFPDGTPILIGKHGFRATGFHEQGGGESCERESEDRTNLTHSSANIVKIEPPIEVLEPLPSNNFSDGHEAGCPSADTSEFLSFVNSINWGQPDGEENIDNKRLGNARQVENCERDYKRKLEQSESTQCSKIRKYH
mmetsp:Transcript_6179/g.9699  ORF Transcript_6179/g.9699 Transcript_6179/m.9699 type:complete len:228 (-) Transcript_6179:1312-1995(-)